VLVKTLYCYDIIFVVRERKSREREGGLDLDICPGAAAEFVVTPLAGVGVATGG